MLNSLDPDSRTHRQELITWWNQEKLSGSRVLVVGAGALGNEIVKNLVLAGIGEIHICDMDRIENSNLSRCVFFIPEDVGEYKATALVNGANKIADSTRLFAHLAPVQQLGSGFLNGFDLIIGGLDNREARLWVNQACRKLGIPWIDGAIEGLQGRVRFFDCSGPCYECTLAETDFVQLAHRKSCALLSPEDIIEGKTPTTASTSSIVAGVQVQEAIKYLTGNLDLLRLQGKCWVYLGDTMESYITSYIEDPDCNSHDHYERIDGPFEFSTLAELLDFHSKRAHGDEPLAIDFDEELLHFENCPDCGIGKKVIFSPFASSQDARCEGCKRELMGSMRMSLESSDSLIALPLSSFGRFERTIITLRNSDSRFHYMVKSK